MAPKEQCNPVSIVEYILRRLCKQHGLRLDRVWRMEMSNDIHIRWAGDVNAVLDMREVLVAAGNETILVNELDNLCRRAVQLLVQKAQEPPEIRPLLTPRTELDDEIAWSIAELVTAEMVTTKPSRNGVAKPHPDPASKPLEHVQMLGKPDTCDDAQERRFAGLEIDDTPLEREDDGVDDPQAKRFAKLEVD